MKRVLLAIVGALALYGCGGGNEPTAAQVSGRIADGYIRGATVFWDCNGNMTLDSSEPSVISGDGGRYTISSAPIAVAPLTECVLRAVIPPNAIDEDDGKPVGNSYVMAAVPGNPEFISPLTTLVSYGSFTEDELRSEFELGNNFSTAADYIAAKSDGAKSHTLAKFVALGLQAVDGVISTGVSSVQTATIRGMVVDIPRDVVSLGAVSAEQLRSHRDNKLPDFSEYSEFSVALATGEFYIDQAAIDAQPNPKEARRLVDLAYAAIQRHPISRVGASINWQVIPYDERTKFSSELSNP